PALRQLTLRRRPVTPRISEDHVRERVAANLLPHRTGPNLLHQAPAIEDRRGCLVTARIMRKPGLPAPVMIRPHDARMLASDPALAPLREQMPECAPGRRHLDLDEQIEQPLDQPALRLTRLTKPLRPKRIKSAPDQLEIETDREHPLLQACFASVIHLSPPSH